MTRRASTRALLGRRGWLGALGSLSLGALAGGPVASSLLGCSAISSALPALWFSYGGKNREALLALVKAFGVEQPEHRLRAVYQGDYFELLAKLRTAMHAGAVPAVTHVIAEVMPYLAEAGVLEPLDELEGLSGDLELVPELAQEGAFTPKPGRRLYGLPFNRSTPIAYLNGAVLDELGLAPPTTWEELERFAALATKGEGSDRRFGFACPIDWWFWVALVGQAGGELVDAEGRYVLGAEAGERALALWQRLVHEQGVMRPPPGRDYNAWQVTNLDFLAGRAAMIWTSTAFLRYLEENAKFRVVAAPLPRDVRHAVPTGGTMFVVPRAATSEEKRHAAAFLRFMVLPERANEFATKTGYIPVSRAGIAELERSGWYASHANDAVARDQLRHVRPWPWSPELFRVQREVVQPRLEEAVLERRPPREVLASARHAIEEGM